MMRIIFTISLFLFSNIAFTQEDSTWYSSLTVRYKNGLIPISQAKYQIISIESTLKKKTWTIVPRVSQKSLHTLTGYLLGTALYKEFNWGYLDGAAHYSRSKIFPNWTLKGNAHLNILKGLSTMCGMQTYKYSNGDSRSVISLGSTYYVGTWMGSYALNGSIFKNFSHKLIARKYLAQPSDFLQLGFYYGSFTNIDVLGNPSERLSSTIQLALHKMVWKNIQVQCSLSSVGTTSDNTTKRHINFVLALKKNF